MYQQMQDLMEESGAYRFLTHEATPVMYRDDDRSSARPDGRPLYRYFSRPAREQAAPQIETAQG